MNTRREFLRLLGGLAAAVGLGRVARGVPPAAPRRVPGVNYFRVPDHMPPVGTKVCIDGKDCTGWAYEADLAAGWVKGYEHHVGGNGRIVLHLDREHGRHPVNVWHGKVELRPEAAPPFAAEDVKVGAVSGNEANVTIRYANVATYHKGKFYQPGTLPRA